MPPRSEYGRTVTVSRHPEQILAAQRLRRGDEDDFDARGDHLLVREAGALLAACRLISPARSRLLAAEAAFDLSALAAIRPRMLEFGGLALRPTGDPGPILAALLDGVSAHLATLGARHLLATGPCEVASAAAPAAEAWARPYLPWHGGAVAAGDDVPSLLVAALRERGAVVAGPPAYDPSTGGAEVVLLWTPSPLPGAHIRGYSG